MNSLATFSVGEMENTHENINRYPISTASKTNCSLVTFPNTDCKLSGSNQRRNAAILDFQNRVKMLMGAIGLPPSSSKRGLRVREGLTALDKTNMARRPPRTAQRMNVYSIETVCIL